MPAIMLPISSFGAADQDARVDAEGIADQAEHDDGADAETAAATDRKPEPAAAHAAARVVATVFDVVAAAKIIVTHGGFPSFSRCAGGSGTLQRSTDLKFPLH